MSKDIDEQGTQLVSALEKVRQEGGLSRHQLADKLGIPFNTFRAWFHKKGAKRPSKAYIRKLDAFVVEKAQAPTAAWDRVWEAVRAWWRTQHRYGTMAEFAEEIGWSADELGACLRGGASPPRLVAERIARELEMETPLTAPHSTKARRKVSSLRALLNLVVDDLAFFRDGPKVLRDIYRSELDHYDIAYVSSLLTMMTDEDKFQRWLTLTTNRFNAFTRKGGRT